MRIAVLGDDKAYKKRLNKLRQQLHRLAPAKRGTAPNSADVARTVLERKKRYASRRK